MRVVRSKNAVLTFALMSGSFLACGAPGVGGTGGGTASTVGGGSVGVTFTGPNAGAITSGGSLVYSPDKDLFFYWSGSPPDSNLYSISPTTYAVSIYPTSGVPPSKSPEQGLTSVYRRFLYLPQYKCIAHYGSTTGDDFTFLPLANL